MSDSRRVYVDFVVLALVVLGFAVAAVNASAITINSCDSGDSFSWTGGGDGTSWGDNMNWSPEDNAPPKTNDTATIGFGSISAPGVSVCNLTLSGSASLDTGGGLPMQVAGNLTWDGPQDPNADPGTIVGGITVGGTAELSSRLSFTDSGPAAAFTSNGPLQVDRGTNLVIENGARDSIVVNGLATLGSGLSLSSGPTISSNHADEGDGNARMVLNGSLDLATDASAPQLDVNMGPNGHIELGGHTLNLPGLSFSRWHGGSQVSSSSPGGVVAFTNLGELLTNGVVTVGQNALVSMQGNSVLTDGTPSFPGEPSGIPGVLKGAGALEWQNGTLAGSITLAPGFRSFLDANGQRALVNVRGVRLINQGTMQIQDGELDVAGPPAEVENQGTVDVLAGSTLSCNTQCPGAYVNDAGAKLNVKDHFALDPASSTVTLQNTGLLNNGQIDIPRGKTVLAQAGSHDVLHDGGTLTGGGTFRIGDGDTTSVIGTTTLQGSTVLVLNGEGAHLHGGTKTPGGSFPGTLEASSAGSGGTFRWLNGGIDGKLLTQKRLRTFIDDGGAGTGHTLDDNQLDANPTLLTLGSPTNIDGTEVTIGSSGNGSAVAVAGPVVLHGAQAGFARNSSFDDGVLVTPGGSLTSSSRGGMINAPLTVKGRLAASRRGTLTAPLGYKQTGSRAETSLNGGTVSTDDGFGKIAGILLDGGRLDGSGKVVANVVSAGGRVTPSANGRTPGKMTITGDYVQKNGGALSLQLVGPGARQHDVLAVGGTARLAGRLIIVNHRGYRPRPSTTIRRVLQAGSRRGRFSRVSSAGTPRNTAWLPIYLGDLVNLILRP
jgi:hypothetical protein